MQIRNVLSIFDREQNFEGSRFSRLVASARVSDPVLVEEVGSRPVPVPAVRTHVPQPGADGGALRAGAARGVGARAAAAPHAAGAARPRSRSRPALSPAGPEHSGD